MRSCPQRGFISSAAAQRYPLGLQTTLVSFPGRESCAICYWSAAVVFWDRSHAISSEGSYCTPPVRHDFPIATLVVNTTGCLAIGTLAGFAEKAGVFAPATRLFLITGFLGGYTTFSAFGYETFFLAREHAWQSAAVNVIAQVVLSLAAVFAGYRLAVVLAA